MLEKLYLVVKSYKENRSIFVNLQQTHTEIHRHMFYKHPLCFKIVLIKGQNSFVENFDGIDFEIKSWSMSELQENL